MTDNLHLGELKLICDYIAVEWTHISILLGAATVSLVGVKLHLWLPWAAQCAVMLAAHWIS